MATKKMTKREFILNGKTLSMIYDKGEKNWRVVKDFDGKQVVMRVTTAYMTSVRKSIGLITSVKQLMALLEDKKYHSFSIRSGVMNRTIELRMFETNGEKQIEECAMSSGEIYVFAASEIGTTDVYDQIVFRSLYDDALLNKYLARKKK